MWSNYKENFKVVILGDKSTGKTCLMKRYFQERFDTVEPATISATLATKVFISDNKEYQMEVWDTSGEERYQAIGRLYYRRAKAAIICYDVTLYKTFQKLNYWINELQQVQETCRLYVCATKSDLLEEYEANPQLSYVESMAHENNAKFFLTSSKTGENICKLFDEIIQDYVSYNRTTPKSLSTIKLPTKARLWRRKKRKCCSNR